MTLTTGDVRRRLHEAVHAGHLERLGLRPDDAADVRAAVAVSCDREDDLVAVAEMVERLDRRLGRLRTAEQGGAEVWAGLPNTSPGGAVGVLPILALVAAVPDVRAFHAARGISDEVSWATLADLGHQVWVHRLTHGAFGLGTEWWLSLVWSGAFYWLGRLQFNLQPAEDDPEAWVLGTHIPRGGSLAPELVDASFAAARAFFREHFPDCPVREIFCHSWMLDPALSEMVPGSNLASFQQRWEPYGEASPGDGDVLFFVFLERGSVDLDTLPTDTRLRRAVAERLAAGQHWSAVSGRLAS